MRNRKHPLDQFTPQNRKPQSPDRQFDDFDATTLFCSRCQKAVPVRKRLLLALPEGDKYDYLCVYCGNSVGTKTETSDMPIQFLLQ